MWRMVLAATLIGMLTMCVNYSWMVASTAFFDLKVSSFTNCMLLGNLFIGITIAT